MSARIHLIGTSHHCAPLEQRERLAIQPGDEPDVVLELLAQDGIDEAVVLSTCNRVELVIATEDSPRAQVGVRRVMQSRGGCDDSWIGRFAYEKEDADAVRHLFRVAASLDSLVVGEPQILGQMKQAYAASQDAGGTGSVLNRLFHHAFKAGKRVRTETGIAENAVSISYAAVELAKKVFGDLAGKQVLVVGAGKMGGLAVRHLVDAGADRVHIMNRTVDRARDMASSLGGTAHGMDELDSLLERVDIVISSTGSQDYVLKHDSVKRALSKRRYRPLFLVDIAVPRDVDPRCASLQSTYLFDVDDLERVVEANMAARRAEADKAEDLVRREARELEAWLAQAKVVPTIVSLRAKLTRLKDDEIERMRLQNPDLPPEAIEAASKMAHLLINKVLHEPTISLRNASTSDHHRTLVAAVRSLFDLSDDDESNPARAGDTRS